MLPRNALGLIVLLISSAAVGAQTPDPQQANPNAIRIEIGRGEAALAAPPKTYVVGELFTFHLLITNISSEPLPLLIASGIILQERPELRQDGKPLPYRRDAVARLEAVQAFEHQPRRPGLLPPNRPTAIGDFELDDWFEPLRSGRYELIVRHRFKQQDAWIESSLTFDVLPAAPQLTKTPFASAALLALDDDVVRTLLKQRPAWRHGRTNPILGSENIMIDNWYCGRERVLTHMVETSSPEIAARSLRQHYPEASERLNGLGDEAMVVSGNKVVFRKGRFLIDVSSGVNSHRLEFGRQTKINREFAQYIADALPANGLDRAVDLTPAPMASAAQLKIALAPISEAGSRDHDARPFKTGEKIAFGLVMKNVSPAPVKVQVYFDRRQDRPELFREGQLVPYLNDVATPATEDKVSIDYSKLILVLLQPNEPEAPAIIKVADWYGSLPPGHYRLTNMHRLDPWQRELIDCGSITFEVIP